MDRVRIIPMKSKIIKPSVKQYAHQIIALWTKLKNFSQNVKVKKDISDVRKIVEGKESIMKS